MFRRSSIEFRILNRALGTEKGANVEARAIWQGKLVVQNHEIDFKLYSAAVDRQIHFHLLHKRDRTRVQQRMVDEETGKPVPLENAKKAFEAKPGLYVLLTPEEIAQGAPEPDREIKVVRFVPVGAIEPQFFDRPYFLGPTDNSAADYFALAKALDRKGRAGIASFVMRKHYYVGALISRAGYLMLITLRFADEIVPLNELEPPQGRALDVKEQEMAQKLIDALSGEFNPSDYHDEFQTRLKELVDAKRSGKKLKAARAPRRRQEGSLAESLRASLKRVSASRSARSRT